MSSQNNCRALVLYQAPIALKRSKAQAEERRVLTSNYVLSPLIMSFLSEVARQSVLVPLLYQPTHGMGADLDRGEWYNSYAHYLLFKYAPAAENYLTPVLSVSYDVCCHWSYEHGRTDGEGVERADYPQISVDAIERAWAASRIEAPVRAMGPGKRHARL
ncbi:hypothetical protein B0H11DRAFT_2223329 [Mycena galericulata]|nr:hypothetical protein B0H11DRAFT_2223329 [Mycena galericulata]